MGLVSSKTKVVADKDKKVIFLTGGSSGRSSASWPSSNSFVCFLDVIQCYVYRTACYYANPLVSHMMLHVHKGIGKETALTLIKRGHVVYGAARRVDMMQDLVEAGGHAISMDVSEDAQIKAAVEKVVSEQGRIDVLINNAGFGLHGPVEDVSIENAKRQFDVNLFGVAALTKEVLPFMRKQASGTIINVSSVNGKVHLPYGAWYVASKHALEGWSDCLRLEVEPFGIKVSIVEPGAIKTDYFKNTAGAKNPSDVTSNDSPYKANFDTVMKNITNYNEQSGASPSVIASTILTASESKYPKRRYPTGGGGFLIFVRAWFGDGVTDALLRQFMK
jgi:NAD(P)-dependent dehydrogenase (short-subunit alcohol dehydrogenase family)